MDSGRTCRTVTDERLPMCIENKGIFRRSRIAAEQLWRKITAVERSSAPRLLHGGGAHYSYFPALTTYPNALFYC